MGLVNWINNFIGRTFFGAEVGKVAKYPLMITLAGLMKGYSLANIQWLIKQSILETGLFKDHKVETYNNLYGMSRVYTRPSVGIIDHIQLADGNTFSVYKNAWSSILDRMKWDEYQGINPRSKDYAREVHKGGYHGSPTYSDSVNGVVQTGAFNVYCNLITLALLPAIGVGIMVACKKFLK